MHTVEASWKGLKRILCVRLDAMGDVLMTEPAIRALKESFPYARVTLLTSPSGNEAGRLLPAVDDILVYEAPWMKSTDIRQDSSVDHDFISEVRALNFDAAVIFTVYSQNPLSAALFCHLADIPRRLAHCRENPYQLLNHWVREAEPEKNVRHEVRRQLDLVGSVGARTNDERIHLKASSAAQAEVRQLLRKHSVDIDSPFIVVHAGATAASRRYPMESFAAVVKGLSTELAYPVLLTGTAQEAGLIDAIRETARTPCVPLAGSLNLAEFAALLGRATLLVSNNTGAVHVAAGARTPVVDLYALTNPQHTPWLVPSRILFHDVPCRYCYKSICPETHNDCLRKVEPDEVVHAALDLLDELGIATSSWLPAVPLTLPSARGTL